MSLAMLTEPDPFLRALAHLAAAQLDGSVVGHYDARNVCTGATLVLTVALDPALPLPAQITRVLAMVPQHAGERHLSVRFADGGLLPLLEVRTYCAR